MNKSASSAQHTFLGYEFLTWFFLLLDREDGASQVQNIFTSRGKFEGCQVVLGTKLVTCLLNHREQKTSVASPLLEDSHEIFASLRNGHVIESLSVCIKFAEISVALVLHAEDFAFTQLKINNNFDSQTFDQEASELSEAELKREEVFLRMAAVEDTEGVIDSIFDHFIRRRLVPKDFTADLQQMRSQIEKRLSHYLQVRQPAGALINETLR